MREGNIGGYKQGISFKKGNIDIWCTCAWGSIHRNQWHEPGTLCWHIKEFVKKIEGKKEKKMRGGYVLIYKLAHKYSKTKKGWIYEHRAVVEDFIERKLKKRECIHHLNNRKKDNRIENLMLFKNHKEHAKFHAKIKQFGMTNPIKRQIQNRWKEFK